MRILTIGYSLPNQLVDNHTVLNAPSITDYEAAFVDPENFTRAPLDLLEGRREFTAHDGRPVHNGATSAAAVSIADQLRRRGAEAERFLDQGGALFVVGRPNATVAGVTGFEGCDRFSWLPAPEGAAWGPPHLRAAEGKTIRIADDQHPLSDALREFRQHLSYRAVLDPALAKAGSKARVIALGGSALPVAAEFPVLAGRVVMTPVFANVTGPTRAKLAQALVDAISEVAAGATAETPPSWTRTLALPGSEELEAEAREAEEAEAEASARTEAARDRLARLTAHRRLLWASGPAFAEAVREGLALLGLRAVSERGEPLAVADAEGDGDTPTAFVEVESVREAAAEWPYVRLQRRLERHLLEDGAQLRGIIVVNGKRHLNPSARREEFTAALRAACENYGYALLTGRTLFALVTRALEEGGVDGAPFEAAGRRLLHARGLVGTERALGEADEPDEAGIF